MSAEPRSRKRLAYSLVVLGSFVVSLVWVFTAEVSAPGGFAYGTILTLEDEGSAKVFGAPGPGVYVANRRGKLLGAVRGGLYMILSQENPSLGFRAVKAGLNAGKLAIAAACLVFVALVAYLVGRFADQKT